VALTAIAIRLPYLEQPMRFDESYTFLSYASQPLYVTIAKYDTPNNHILHSVLLHMVWTCFGSDPAVLRLPAIVAGVLTAVVGGWLTSRWAGSTAALLAGVWIATSSPLVEYSTLARGYTLVHFWVLLIWVVIDECLISPSRVAAVLTGVLGALALWTIPTTLYAGVLLGTWYVVTRRTSSEVRAGRVVAAMVFPVAVCLVLCGILYAPAALVSGWAGLAEQSRATESMSLPMWFAQSVEMLTETWRLWTRDLPLPAMLALAGGVVLCGVSDDQKLRSTLRASTLGVLLMALVVIAQRVSPPPRTWLFLGPVMCCLSACGWAEWISRTGIRRYHRVLLGALLLVAGLWPVFNIIRNESILTSQETGSFPDAQQIVSDLADELRPDEPVVAISPASAPLVYYALRQGVARRHFDPAPASARSAIVVVERNPRQQIEDVLHQLQISSRFTPESAVLLKQYPGAEVFRISSFEH